MKLEGISWSTVLEPSDAEAAPVDEGLERFNRAAAELDAIERFACFARDASGVTLGGALARSWGAACELQQIWVAEELRGQGVGGALLRLVEQEARRRGCTLLYLDTFSFQAPGFYRKQGYELACELSGFPGGASKLILRKAL